MPCSKFSDTSEWRRLPRRKRRPRPCTRIPRTMVIVRTCLVAIPNGLEKGVGRKRSTSLARLCRIVVVRKNADSGREHWCSVRRAMRGRAMGPKGFSTMTRALSEHPDCEACTTLANMLGGKSRDSGSAGRRPVPVSISCKVRDRVVAAHIAHCAASLSKQPGSKSTAGFDAVAGAARSCPASRPRAPCRDRKSLPASLHHG